MPFRDWFFKDRSFHVKVVKDGEAGEEIVHPSQLAKTHWDKWKPAYIIGGAAVASVGITGLVLGRGSVAAAVGLVSEDGTVLPQIINNVAPVFNNHNELSNVVNGGYMRKIIRCVETDEMWPSMTKAAEAAGHTLQNMSKQIHGHHDHLDGLHYVIEGLAA